MRAQPTRIPRPASRPAPRRAAVCFALRPALRRPGTRPHTYMFIYAPSNETMTTSRIDHHLSSRICIAHNNARVIE
ncbi:unnamed protein product [Pieris brassicae]|uniref:Uncharacterized protein n=1 Tax=Pieris brassicae TaxID=7116 RepID=A0A9P0TIL7_PIEBR|nr:unnamed protein product [Pieris brassicae]